MAIWKHPSLYLHILLSLMRDSLQENASSCLEDLSFADKLWDAVMMRRGTLCFNPLTANDGNVWVVIGCVTKTPETNRDWSFKANRNTASFLGSHDPQPSYSYLLAYQEWTVAMSFPQRIRGREWSHNESRRRVAPCCLPWNNFETYFCPGSVVEVDPVNPPEEGKAPIWMMLRAFFLHPSPSER